MSSPPCFEDCDSAQSAALPVAPAPPGLPRPEDLANIQEEVLHLMLELQNRRNRSRELSSHDVSTGWSGKALQASRRAQLAEQAAQRAAAAVRRLAAEGEKEAIKAAEVTPKLEAALHENELLKTRVRELMVELNEYARKELDAPAQRAAHDAWKRSLVSSLESLKNTMSDLVEKQKRAEATVDRLEREMEAEMAVRGRSLEERTHWEERERELQQQLSSAAEQQAIMAAKIGSLLAEKAASQTT